MSVDMAMVETVILKDKKSCDQYLIFRRWKSSQKLRSCLRPHCLQRIDLLDLLSSVPKAGRVLLIARLQLPVNHCPLYLNNEHDESLMICKSPYSMTMFEAWQLKREGFEKNLADLQQKEWKKFDNMKAGCLGLVSIGEFKAIQVALK